MEGNICQLEELLLNSIPARQTVVFDGWVVRLNDHYTYRANCVCPLHYDSEKEIIQKVKYCEELFNRQEMPTVFKVTPSLQKGFAEILTRMGYEKIKTVNVMGCEVAQEMPEQNLYLECHEKPDEEWLKASVELTGVLNPGLASVHCEGIRNITVESIFVEARIDGKIVGCGYGTVERNYVGIYDLHVLPQYREKGFGTAICNVILAFGKRNGAHEAYLIVHSKNQNAISLYEHKGFRKVYEYYFFQKPYGTFQIIDA